ncbi:MAG: hypothetical protein ACXVCY_18845 [Pseudobdellovibrionaceae bacterium]
MKTKIKLNQYKAFKFIKATLVSATLLTSLASLATIGGGSGNGNGDEAFALQHLAESNPGLQPHEVLMKAFSESAGRSMELSFFAATENRRVEAAYLLGKSSQNIFYFEDLKDTSLIYRGIVNFNIVRSSISDGPLLGGNKEKGTLYETTRSVLGFEGKLLSSSSSLLLETEVIVGSEVKRQTVEFRQYNSKIVIFVKKPVNSDGKFYCPKPYATLKDVEPGVPSVGVCSIGYIWKD